MMILDMMICICCALVAPGVNSGAGSPASKPAVRNGGAVATTSAPQSAEIVVFVDRFGNLFLQEQSLEQGQVISQLKERTVKGQGITVVYEPFSLESDRKGGLDTLRREFPGYSIKERPVETGDGYGDKVFPHHRSTVQSEVLSRRNAMWDTLLNHHRQLAEQIRTYIASAGLQLAKIRSEAALLSPDTQHPGTQPSE